MSHHQEPIYVETVRLSRFTCAGCKDERVEINDGGKNIIPSGWLVMSVEGYGKDLPDGGVKVGSTVIIGWGGEIAFGPKCVEKRFAGVVIPQRPLGA